MITDALTPGIERLDEGQDPTYGKFMIEPLERGYGQTLGAALRRVLLSSIPGAAVSAVQIEGVLHEFSTIPGMVEDTMEMLINLKRLAIKWVAETDVMAEAEAEQEPKMLRLERRGPGEVLAADIECPPEIEVVNKDLHIATLDSDDSRLVMDLEVTR